MNAEAWIAAAALIFTVLVTACGGIAVLMGMRADIRNVISTMRTAIGANDREHAEFRRDIRNHGEEIAGLKAQVGHVHRAA